MEPLSSATSAVLVKFLREVVAVARAEVVLSFLFLVSGALYSSSWMNCFLKASMMSFDCLRYFSALEILGSQQGQMNFASSSYKGQV